MTSWGDLFCFCALWVELPFANYQRLWITVCNLFHTIIIVAVVFVKLFCHPRGILWIKTFFLKFLVAERTMSGHPFLGKAHGSFWLFEAMSIHQYLHLLSLATLSRFSQPDQLVGAIAFISAMSCRSICVRRAKSKGFPAGKTAYKAFHWSRMSLCNTLNLHNDGGIARVVVCLVRFRISDQNDLPY
jgi:hypothetical protein